MGECGVPGLLHMSTRVHCNIYDGRFDMFICTKLCCISWMCL